MATEVSTQEIQAHGKKGSVVLLGLALGAALAALVALAGTAPQAEAASSEKIVFSSDRTTGKGVNNPTGDYEIFSMNPDGTALKQLTFNQVGDANADLSTGGTKITYQSYGKQNSNPEGDNDIYVMNASDGSGKKNLTNNRGDVSDHSPAFSPGGKRIAYTSVGVQTSNPEGDAEVYRMNALDGLGKRNLSDSADGVYDYYPVFSPDGTKIAYQSHGVQTSNPEGDYEVYVVNVLDGSEQKNLTDNGVEIPGAHVVDDSDPVFSPDGKSIAYESYGEQTYNPEGDWEVYTMNAEDGSEQKNLSNNGSGVNDDLPIFSPDGTKVAYESYGKQTSNLEGDFEIYRVNALDGSEQKNLTNNGADVDDYGWAVYSPGSTRIAYLSHGVQTSNPEGDYEVYRMNALDGSGKRNLSNNASGVDDAPEDWGVQGI